MNLSRLRSLYCINQFFHYLPLGLVFPISTLYFLEKGFHLGMIGTALALYSLTVLILELPTGGLADRIGRIRLYRIALGVNLISNIFFLFCRNYGMMLVGMIFMGVGRALNSGSIDAWFVDAHPENDEPALQKSMALSAGIIPAALGISTLLGGVLPDLTSSWPRLWGEGRYSWNLFFACGAGGLHIIFTLIALRELPFQKEPKNESFGSFMTSVLKTAWTSKILRRLLVISLALGVGLSAVEGLWQPRVRTLVPDSPSLLLGILASVYFFSASLGSLFSSFLLRHFGEKITLTTMKILHGVSLIGLGLVSGIYGFTLCFALLFVFHGALDGPHQTLLNRNIPSQMRSSLLSLDSFAMMIGGGIGSLAFGWISKYGSIPLSWGIAGSVLILSALLYLPISKGGQS